MKAFFFHNELTIFLSSNDSPKVEKKYLHNFQALDPKHFSSVATHQTYPVPAVSGKLKLPRGKNKCVTHLVSMQARLMRAEWPRHRQSAAVYLP